MRVVRFASCVAVCLALTATFATAAPGEGKKGPPDPEKAFARKDADKNGTLTLDEFKAGMKDEALGKAETRFRKLDGNGDGGVTIEELKSGMKQRRKS
jgi:hypothetical protein